MQSSSSEHAAHEHEADSPPDDVQKMPRPDRVASGCSVFQHKPLDHTQASIRLLKVLPDLSSAGLIQCQIWHDNIDAQYDCLSYEWGEDGDGQFILLDGEEHWIRRNLLGFLGVARTKYAGSERTLWIDALCIDQSSIAERNHQVAQMGSIYRNAQGVILWLGFSHAIRHVLTFCVQLDDAMPLTAAEAWELWDRANLASNSRDSLRRSWRALANHTYWKRAWISQEVFLARKHTILAGDLAIEPLISFRAVSMLLPGINKHGRATKPEGGSWDADMRIFNTYMETLCGKKKFKRQRLIELLHKLPKRESQIPRDRIYSLRALMTHKDAKTIVVDYASSDFDFLLQMIGVFRHSMCLCLWSYLTTTFDWRWQSSPYSPLAATLRMPVFRIALNTANKSSSAHDSRHPPRDQLPYVCPICGAQLSVNVPKADLICIRAICDRTLSARMTGSHWWLRKPPDYPNPYSLVGRSFVRDASAPCRVGDAEVVALRLDIGNTSVIDASRPFIRLGNSILQRVRSSRNTTALYLTADQLNELLQHSPWTSYTGSALCSSARSYRGPLKFLKAMSRSAIGTSGLWSLIEQNDLFYQRPEA
jgi:hypothetical protein